MPGRVSLRSPGGTGEIVMPDDPNFMCTGLVTVALFFGSRNITLAFAAAGFFIWALAKAPPATTITNTGSTSCLLSFISAISFSRSHSMAFFAGPQFFAHGSGDLGPPFRQAKWEGRRAAILKIIHGLLR